MAEYISREAALSEACHGCSIDFSCEPCEPQDCEIKARLEAIPAADVVEVRHGRWSVDEIHTHELSYGTTAYEPVYKCSVCGRLTESYLRYDEPIMPEDADFPRYCPNCGAKMDGGLD